MSLKLPILSAAATFLLISGLTLASIMQPVWGGIAHTVPWAHSPIFVATAAMIVAPAIVFYLLSIRSR